jgi:heterodisulfide reductase subunit C
MLAAEKDPPEDNVGRSAFHREFGALVHFKVAACYQCKRCTNGCPVTFAMDLYPDEIIRRVNLGDLNRVLGTRTIWICSSCETCSTRCPNEVDIAGVMDFLKEMAVQRGLAAPEAQTRAFHESFLKEIEKRGRIFEGGLMQRYLLKSGEGLRKLADGSIREDMALGFSLLRRGRMPLWPERIRDRKTVRKLMKHSR